MSLVPALTELRALLETTKCKQVIKCHKINVLGEKAKVERRNIRKW